MQLCVDLVVSYVTFVKVIYQILLFFFVYREGGGARDKILSFFDDVIVFF